MRKFYEAQTTAYELGAGWIHWTWKVCVSPPSSPSPASLGNIIIMGPTDDVISVRSFDRLRMLMIGRTLLALGAAGSLTIRQRRYTAIYATTKLQYSCPIYFEPPSSQKNTHSFI